MTPHEGVEAPEAHRAYQRGGTHLLQQLAGSRGPLGMNRQVAQNVFRPPVLMPVSVAVDIAEAEDGDIQKLLPR